MPEKHAENGNHLTFWASERRSASKVLYISHNCIKMLRFAVSHCKSFKKLPSKSINVHKFTFSTNPDNFLSGSNSVYVEQMYDQWQTDPKRQVSLCILLNFIVLMVCNI